MSRMEYNISVTGKIPVIVWLNIKYMEEPIHENCWYCCSRCSLPHRP